MEGPLKHEQTSALILKAFYQVYSDLGYGFLERVYENSLIIAARGLGLRFERQVPIRVHYQGQVVGQYFADLIAERAIIIEIKAARSIAAEHEAQLLNYLKSTHYEVGLLLNFGPKAEFRRRILDNNRKGNLTWYHSNPCNKNQ